MGRYRKVHGVVRKALKSGDLERKPCEVCGSPTSVAHHDDYEKPLEVRWLCYLHHSNIHYNQPMRMMPWDIERQKRYSREQDKKI